MINHKECSDHQNHIHQLRSHYPVEISAMFTETWMKYLVIMTSVPSESYQRSMSLYIQPIHLHPWLDDIGNNPEAKFNSNL